MEKGLEDVCLSNLSSNEGKDDFKERKIENGSRVERFLRQGLII